MRAALVLTSVDSDTVLIRRSVQMSAIQWEPLVSPLVRLKRVQSRSTYEILMKRIPSATLASLLFTLLFAATSVRTPAQSDCAALNAAKGEGKFTGQISSTPDGSSMEVIYGGGEAPILTETR